jgi:Fe-S-cluster containining protein
VPHACENCGVCCLDLPLPPFDANEEVIRASEDLLRQVETYARGPRYRESNPCIWLDLDLGKCRHHDVRPAACRWFVPGGAACNELRQKAGLPPIPEAEEAE